VRRNDNSGGHIHPRVSSEGCAGLRALRTDGTATAVRKLPDPRVAPDGELLPKAVVAEEKAHKRQKAFLSHSLRKNRRRKVIDFRDVGCHWVGIERAINQLMTINAKAPLSS
jgi:hypothetical protein